MQHAFVFWYVKSASWAWHHYRENVGALEEQLAIRATARNIGRPLFQDYTWQGRVIGVLFRIARIVLGGLLYGILGVAYVAGFLFWVVLPILCVVSLVGFFIAPSSPITSQTTTPTVQTGGFK